MRFFRLNQQAPNTGHPSVNVTSRQINKCIDEAILAQRTLQLNNHNWRLYYVGSAGFGLFTTLAIITAGLQFIETRAYNKHYLISDNSLTCSDAQSLHYLFNDLNRDNFNSMADFEECGQLAHFADASDASNLICSIMALTTLMIASLGYFSKPQFYADFKQFPSDDSKETLLALGFNLNSNSIALDELIEKLKALKQMKLTHEYQFEVDTAVEDETHSP